MDKNNISRRMDTLEQKLDQVLDHVNQQRLRAEATDDLVTDLSLIGKEVYNDSVIELEKQDIEIDPDELRQLGVNLLKNIKNFNEMLTLVDSMMDLKQDASPILNELIIEFTKNLHLLEKKGYFEFAREMGTLADNIVTGFTPEDLRTLSQNIVPLLHTLKEMTRPELLKTVNNAMQALDESQQEPPPSYSLFKVMKEMNSREMKSAMGFMITFLKKFSKINNHSNH